MELCRTVDPAVPSAVRFFSHLQFPASLAGIGQAKAAYRWQTGGRRGVGTEGPRPRIIHASTCTHMHARHAHAHTGAPNRCLLAKRGYLGGCSPTGYLISECCCVEGCSSCWCDGLHPDWSKEHAISATSSSNYCPGRPLSH